LTFNTTENKILDGKKLAETIYTKLETDISPLKNKPTLWAVLIWGEDSPSFRYIKQKRKFAEKIWMNFRLFQFEEDISESDFIKEIHTLNNDSHISGYIVQLPIPQHIDITRVIRNIDPKKDVDGFHPQNQWKIMIWDHTWLSPCTPAGIMEIFQQYDIKLSWKKIVVLWQSNIVWKPIALMCMNKWATVLSCNHETPDISLYTKDADIIISATGQIWLLHPGLVNPKAIIIDVGFTVKEGKIYGDAQFDELLAQWNLITPVPGWVGPMTVAMLLSNTMKAHEQKR